MGVISVMSNAYPREVSDICELYFSGRFEESLEHQVRALPLIRALFCETNPSPIKYVMKELGYCGGRVIIGHCLAPDMASALSSHIKQSFPDANVKINKCGALCSFYAEVGGLIIGFEN